MRARPAVPVLAFVLALPIGPATADGIDIGGTAQMGLVGTSTPSGEHRTRLLYDLDLTLRASHTTDFGLTIGIELDLDEMLDEAETSRRGWAQRIPE